MILECNDEGSRRPAALLGCLDTDVFAPVGLQGAWPLRLAFRSDEIASLVEVFAVEVVADPAPRAGIAMRRLVAPRPLALTWYAEEPLRLVVGIFMPDPVLDVDEPVLVVAERARVVWDKQQQGPRLPLQSLLDAARLGLVEAETPSGQRFLCLRAERLSDVILAMLNGLGTRHLAERTSAARAGDSDAESASAAATFDARVVRTYGGRCAMCGAGFGGVRAVRVRPVVECSSRVDVRDGIAMCGAHAAAFEHHRFAVDASYGVHTNWTERVGERLGPCECDFLAAFPTRLRLPLAPADAPSPLYLAERLSYFDGAYAWLTSGAALDAGSGSS